MESGFASLKKEEVHLTKYATRAAARTAIFDYVEVFYAPKEVPLEDNPVRRHSKINNQSPYDFERQWHQAQLKKQHHISTHGVRFFEPVHVERFCASRNTRLLIKKSISLKFGGANKHSKNFTKNSQIMGSIKNCDASLYLSRPAANNLLS